MYKSHKIGGEIEARKGLTQIIGIGIKFDYLF